MQVLLEPVRHRRVDVPARLSSSMLRPNLARAARKARHRYRRPANPRKGDPPRPGRGGGKTPGEDRPPPVAALCARPDLGAARAPVVPPEPPDAGELEALVSAAPVMPGAEYLTTAVLRGLWDELGLAFASELAESRATVQDFLKSLDPAWNVVGRVHFNLAENRRDEEAPFAFLATYTPRPAAGPRQAPAPAARAGAARVRRSRQQAAPALPPGPRAARRRALWLAQ